MTENTPPPKSPRLTDKGRRTRQEKQERLARALRENLRRRKAQLRGRRDDTEGSRDRES